MAELSASKQIERSVDGVTQVSYEPSESSQPGDKLAYTIQYRNVGDAVANGAGIVGMIPEGTRFLKVLKMPEGTQLTYSIDAGKSFAAAPITVQMRNPDGSITARELGPEAYTHVRFKLSQALAPAQSGSVRYLVEVE